jgi:hypothetical protein
MDVAAGRLGSRFRDRWGSAVPPLGATWVLLSLLAVDAAFMFIHVVWIYTDVLDDVRFSLAKDRGYSEWWQYAKETAACVLLAVLALRLRAVVLAAWCLALAYIVLDDVLLLHERVNEHTRDWYEGIELYGFSPDDMADLVFTGVVGLTLASILAVAHWRARGSGRRISTGMFVLGVLFAAASIGMDAIGALFEATSFGTLGSLLEDGGELVAMSAIVWFLWLWLREVDAQRALRTDT